MPSFENSERVWLLCEQQVPLLRGIMTRILIDENRLIRFMYVAFRVQSFIYVAALDV